MSTKAGLSRKMITPPVGIYLQGYGNRIQGNIGVHDDIFVTTLVIYNRHQKVALLTVDHTFINILFVERIKEQILSICGIQPQAVFICCSHTHGGPIGYADKNSRPEDRQFMNFLVDSLVNSVVEAQNNLQPVRFVAGVDEAHININRRERLADGSIIIGNNPDGIVDSSVQIVQLQTEDATPLATLVNYACHPVVAGPRNRTVTADWVGAMRQHVEQTIGGLCLFFQGATGNINPRKMDWERDNWDEVTEQGVEVAQAVQRALENATPLNTDDLSSQQAVCWLELMPAKGYNQQIWSFMPAHVKTEEQITAATRERFPWYTLLKEQDEKTYSPVYVGVMRFGDWSLAAIASEPFVETGLAIKAASNAPITFVCGYTNGCNSYLPIKSAYADGGYEVETAALFYGLPAGFAEGGAEIVTNTLIDLLKS